MCDHKHTLTATIPSWLQPLKKHHPDFFKTARIVTMEKKHAIVPWAAEFFCTVTSPFFALPALLYLLAPASSMPLTLHLSIILSLLTSVVSSLYHATLWKVFGAADTSLAVVTFYSATMNMVGAVAGTHPAWRDIGVHLAVLSVTAAIFINQWRKTTWLAVKMFALAVPIAMWALWQLGCYYTLVISMIAMVCFLLDRYKFVPTHLFWHVFGGMASFLCLLYSVTPLSS